MSDAQNAAHSAGGEPGAREFVWGAWGLLTLAAFAFVARYGTSIPFWDDYAVIDRVTGHAPVTIGWLWAQHNEHRIALPKLLLVASERLAGNDVRAGMYLSVATLSGLAALLIGLVARRPGGTRPSDALFPLLLLNLGQAANLLWGFQFSQVLPTALGTAFLAPIALRPAWPHFKTVVLAGAGMILLPLCGGTGLMYTPALALWLLGWGVAQARSAAPGRVARSLGTVLVALPGLSVAALYFRGFHKALHPESADPLWESARAGLQFLTGGLGMITAQGWPWSGLVTLALLALTVTCLARAWVSLPNERPRVFGLLAFLAAPVALAAGVGWGRGWAGESAGFQDRYVTMAVPLWCWMALGLRLYAPPALGVLILNAFFAGLCALAWPNTTAGLERAREGAVQAAALTRDLRDGVPAHRIVRRYTPFLHPSQDELGRLLPTLRDAQVGPFKFLRDPPPFRSTSLVLKPSALRLTRWEGNTAYVTGVDPQITFTLPTPGVVAGIRIRYSHKNRQGAPARFQLTWRHPGQRDYNHDQRYANWDLPTGNEKETTIWIDDNVADFRIQPDNQPCEFRIDDITLLTP